MEDVINPQAAELPYEIEFDKLNTYENPNAEAEMYAIHERLQKKHKNISKLIKDINLLIEKYPDLPPLRNHLATAYMQSGNEKRANEIIDQALQDFPDYLFAIFNKAALCFSNEDYEMIPRLLGPALELHELLPYRKKFHISEFLSYYRLAISYLCHQGELDLATERLQKMQRVDPDAPEVIMAGMEIMRARMQKRAESGYNEIPKDHLSVPQQDSAPVFYHPEVQELYRYSLHIDDSIMQAIMALPRDTVIKDLQEVIFDSIRRFKVMEDVWWDEEKHCFLMHSMVLLAEMKATEALPALLEVLRQGDDYLEFWFGEILTEDLWQVYFQVFDAQAYYEYLCEPRLDTFAKMLISEVYNNKVIAGEINRTEAVKFFSGLFEFFISHKDDNDLLDDNFMGGLVGDVIDLKLIELLPLIKTAYDLALVDESMSGDYKEVVQEIYRSHQRKDRENILAQGYRKFYDGLMSWISAYDDETSAYGDDDYYNDTPVPKELVNILKSDTGRNDPCPCGSGKKYKKCCMV